MRRKSDYLLESIGAVNDRILSLATRLPAMEALEREESITADARALGIPFKLPDPRIPRGEELSILEQKVRMSGSGIICSGKNITITYVVFPENAENPEDADTLTELLLDYDDNGHIRKAYTRSIDRFENRTSVEIPEENLAALEEVFGMNGIYFRMAQQEKRENRRPKM